MSDDPPNNDPLGLFTEEDQSKSQTQDAEDPLWRDLLAYDNPEVFRDSNLPQTYHLKIRSYHALDIPYVLKVEVAGEGLPKVIQETLFWVMEQDPNFDGDVDAIREELDTDSDYWDAVYSIRQFFVRHLPKLLINTYNIAMATAVFYEIGNLMDRRAEREQLIKSLLTGMLRNLEKDVKQMVATRSSGRPRLTEDRMPEIVRQVLKIVREIMGDARGKHAVPVLKTVADKLDLTETALRKKLVRAGHPWAGIKHFFENEP